jgi:nitrous oxidase accessory protein
VKRRELLVRTAVCLIAAVMIFAAPRFPLWKMTLHAPQYPSGLHLTAYGDRLEGDLREINIINHYIGMERISERPAPEMDLFPWAIGGLVVLILIAPLHRILFMIAATGTVALPLGILLDMQWWLHSFGQNLDPQAPLRPDPFTPLVIGTSHIGNFRSVAMISSGIALMLGAAVLMFATMIISRRFRHRASQEETESRSIRDHVASRVGFAAMAAMLLTSPLYGMSLQQRIDAAAPGSRVEVEGGTWIGPIEIDKPIELIGRNWPVIDGGGKGTVILIEASDVVVSGFVLRNSGRSTIEEAAGIKTRGDRHRIEGNRITDVHFGIQGLHGEQLVIRDNEVRPDRGRGYRAGDGIHLWYVRDSSVAGNRVTGARDGIYLSFTSGIRLEDNLVTGSRYGIHSMFSDEITVERNHLRDNLLGAALMNSNRLVFRANRTEMHREGATPYGILLKDIGELVLEENMIARNRVGIYADNTPDRLDREAVIRNNTIIGNDSAFSLQSNARLIVTGNRIADNMMTVIAVGGRLSEGNRWAQEGRGNFWSEYAGIDRDGDGIGDYPHEVTDAVDALLHRNPLVRAFLHSPAHRVINLAARMFPLFRPKPLLVDPAPLVRPSTQTPRYR